MVTGLASGYGYWVPMNASGPLCIRRYSSNTLKVGGILILALCFFGCIGAETKKTGKTSSDGGSAAGLARLQFSESQQDMALFELVYSNAGSKEISDIRYAQGRFLLNDQGVFRFEQSKKEPQRNLIVYFNPEREIIVIFPKLKIAYKASPEILSEGEGERLLAAYDGLRMVLCLSNVWNNPEANSIEVASFSDNINLQQQGRPYRWIVEMDVGASTSPISTMRARQGFKQMCSIERKANSIQQYSRSNKDAFMRGAPGQLKTGNEWSLIFPGHSRQSDFVFTPYPVKKTEVEDVRSLFMPPEIDPSFQVQELSLDLILDWMGLR
jgi:hypothetical protein